MTVRSAAGFTAMAAGLAFAGIAGAQGVTQLPAIETDSNWPWIAARCNPELLIAVSFVSRRRIHAVVGR